MQWRVRSGDSALGADRKDLQMKYLMLIYGSREKWDSIPAEAWRVSAVTDGPYQPVSIRPVPSGRRKIKRKRPSGTSEAATRLDPSEPGTPARRSVAFLASG